MNIKKQMAILWVMVVLAFGCAADPTNDNHGFNGFGDEDPYADATLDWQDANLTWFESYPDPGSAECIDFNGCTWAGQLAFFGGQTQDEEWIQNTNIAAVHGDDYDAYAGHVLRVRQGDRQIDVMVYDLCSDNDCDGCCTQNSSQTGFLIDMEIYTFERFGGNTGVVQWACLDC